jgi:hypothetical protein
MVVDKRGAVIFAGMDHIAIYNGLLELSHFFIDLAPVECLNPSLFSTLGIQKKYFSMPL